MPAVEVSGAILPEIEGVVDEGGDEKDDDDEEEEDKVEEGVSCGIMLRTCESSVAAIR